MGVKAIGTLCLILDTGYIMDLVYTTYVLVFTRNLISVPKLDSYGYELKFENFPCSIILLWMALSLYVESLFIEFRLQILAVSFILSWA